MKENKHYLAILSEGFPFKISASNNKNLMIAKSLMDKGFIFHVYSKLFYKQNNQTNFTYSGSHQGVNYRFLNQSKSNSAIGVIMSFFKEGYYLFKESRGYKKKYFIVSYSNILIFIYYYLLSKLFGLKMIISIAEWHISVDINKRGFNKWNARLFDKYALRFAKGIIPISKFLAEEASKQKKKEDIFILPILTDFHHISSVPIEQVEYNYFLYCGSIGYIELIEFILESYTSIEKKSISNPVKLKLILYGSKNKIQDLRNRISNDNLLHGRIIIETDLPYENLIQAYKAALALLIPLRNTIQDKARFPHKIAEYLASGRPIITNNWGEVSYYFTHKENAFVAEKYDVDEFSKIMEYVLANEELSAVVGNNGRELCKNKFDYKVYSESLSSFLLKY